MTFIYTIFIILVVIWCVFKYYTQRDMMKDMYDLNYGDHTLDIINCSDEITTWDQPENDRKSNEYKHFYENNIPEILFFNKNKDHIMSRILYSDKLNATFLKYYTVKTGHFVQRPIVQKLLNNFISIGKYFSEKINPPESYTTIQPKSIFSNVSNIFKK